MKLSQAWIILAVLILAGIIISITVQGTIEDKYATPEPADISWQENVIDNGKGGFTSKPTQSSTEPGSSTSSEPSESSTSEETSETSFSSETSESSSSSEDAEQMTESFISESMESVSSESEVTHEQDTSENSESSGGLDLGTS